MAHIVHTTDSLVLGSTPVQDADKLFWLLTKDIGLIFASAKSVREEASKLRYSLQDFSYSKVSLVKGRGLWRITGAEVIDGALDVQNAKVFGDITVLARKIIPAEESSNEAYRVLKEAREQLSAEKESAYKKAIEYLCVARLLYTLGYLEKKTQVQSLIESGTYTRDILDEVLHKKEVLLPIINTGIANTHLV